MCVPECLYACIYVSLRICNCVVMCVNVVCMIISVKQVCEGELVFECGHVCLSLWVCMSVKASMYTCVPTSL